MLRDGSLAGSAVVARRVCYDDQGLTVTALLGETGFSMVAKWRWSGRVVRSRYFRSREFTQGHYYTEREEIMASFVRRVAVEGDGGLRHERAVDEAFGQDYPAIYEFLTLDWLEGAPRLTSTLGISVDAGSFKARLADRDNGLVCFVASESFYGALGALEEALVKGSADWRVDQFAKPKKAAKKP